MIGEIIAIGDELTSGRIANTTSGLAARKLFLGGHRVRAMHTIGDEPALIGDMLKQAVEQADFVIVTGGLGATTDDLTNEAVIKALDLNGAVHPGVLASVTSRMPAERQGDQVSLAKLAWLPQDAEVLDSAYRMAGYLLRHQGKPIYFLPGVPSQMEALLTTKVLPGLASFTTTPAEPVFQRIYRTCGIPESEINNRLVALEGTSDLQIGYYPVGYEVHISLTLRGAAAAHDSRRVRESDAFIRQALGTSLYGTDGESLAAVVGQLLKHNGRTLGVAESCTGGLLGSSITEVPGSSQWFAGGVIAYANEVKHSLLDVGLDLLATHGAVSAEVARAMAGGLAGRLHCAIALSATGIAGPDGGSPEKPVGTVYLGLVHDHQVSDHLYHFTGSRRQIQEKTVLMALDLVRRTLLAHSP